MASLTEQPRKIPFSFETECIAFEKSFNASIAALLHEMRKTFLSSDNIIGYSHGRKWRSHAVVQADEDGEFTEHSTEIVTKFDDIVANDLSIISKTRDEILKNMQMQFMGSMYSTVSEAAEKSGNVVSAKSGVPNAQTFLDLLKKIEFGVDKDGRPSLPEIHASPAVADAMLEELSSQGPDFKAEVERIKKEKIEAALQREEERRSKFRKKSTGE